MSVSVISFLFTFILSIVLFVFFIPVLRIVKFGQSIRTDGPAKHLKKSGTPTMGGLIIILGTTISFIYLSITEIKVSNHDLLLLLIPIMMYGLIGFIDDYLIVVKKNNKGLSAKTKLFFQIIWAGIYFYLFLDKGMSSKINCFGLIIDLKWGYGILILLMLVASSNAVNLSDGLDGLASGLMIIGLSAVIILAYYQKNQPVLIFSLCLLAAILAFLCYNFNPAKVFMGNTGSLALGATLANLFILLKMEILLIIVGFVFAVEALSVIIQVTYFKITKGKRIFRMAPIHHHYELIGLNEWEVDALFWLIGIIFAIIGVIIATKVYEVMI